MLDMVGIWSHMRVNHPKNITSREFGIIDGGRRELEYKMLLKVAQGKLTEDDLNLLRKRGNLILIHDMDKN